MTDNIDFQGGEEGCPGDLLSPVDQGPWLGAASPTEPLSYRAFSVVFQMQVFASF